MMSYIKQIGEKILDTIQSKNISVVTLSKESGYSVKDLYRLVNGNLILPPNGLERIADILGIPVEELIYVEKGDYIT